MQDRLSSWATNQIYMAHFALTDIDKRMFFFQEKFQRSALQMAGAQSNPFQVWLDDWQVRALSPNEYELSAQNFSTNHPAKIKLHLLDLKGSIQHGDLGLSKKGSEPGQASYYYSLARLETTGSLEIDGKNFEVDGLSWMDHEFSTSALSKDQVGWDWFSIQFDDNSELMVFQIRRPMEVWILIPAERWLNQMERFIPSPQMILE